MMKIFIFKIFYFFVIWTSFSCQFYERPILEIEEKRLLNAIKINPVHELAYIRLAQYLENNGRYSETFSVLRTGQKRIPSAVALVRLEGGLYQNLGFYKEANKFYSSKLIKNPNEPLLYLDRAQLYWRMEKFNIALLDLLWAGLCSFYYLLLNFIFPSCIVQIG